MITSTGATGFSLFSASTLDTVSVADVTVAIGQHTSDNAVDILFFALGPVYFW